MVSLDFTEIVIIEIIDYSENSTIASISVIEFNGKHATPTAILECFPLSPNSSNIKSDAGLMTLGCW